MNSSWKEFFDNVDTKVLSQLISDGELTSKTVVPLSLLSLRKVKQAYQLSRKCVTEQAQQNIVNNLVKSASSKTRNNLEEIRREKVLTDKMFNQVCTKRIKPKKRYEIKRLSNLVHSLASNFPDCKTVIDVGAGLGHLSRLLSLHYNFKVHTIEGEQSNVKEANKIDVQFCQQLSKALTNEQISLPTHNRLFLESSEMIDNFAYENEEVCVVGLHPCGNLSSIIIEHFVESKRAKILILISCCYFKLDDKG